MQKDTRKYITRARTHKLVARAIDFQFWTRVSDQIAAHGSGRAITERRELAHNKKAARESKRDAVGRVYNRHGNGGQATSRRAKSAQPPTIHNARAAGDAQHTHSSVGPAR